MSADISCYGQCSTTVALPILSHYGIETAILPSAILSTHTSGFENFTFLDLTDEMQKIIDHWFTNHIEFDCIYTGYIGNRKQFDIILNNKHKILKDGGLFIVDPAMADNGKLYPGLDDFIVLGMRKMCMYADYIIPNVTEACFMTGVWVYCLNLAANTCASSSRLICPGFSAFQVSSQSITRLSSHPHMAMTLKPASGYARKSVPFR